MHTFQESTKPTKSLVAPNQRILKGFLRKQMRNKMPVIFLEINFSREGHPHPRPFFPFVTKEANSMFSFVAVICP